MSSLRNEGTEGVVTVDAVQFIPFETIDTAPTVAKAKYAGKLPEEARRPLRKRLRRAKKSWPDLPSRPAAANRDQR